MRKLILVATLVAAGCDSSHTSTAPTAFEKTSGPSVTAAASVPAQQTTTFGFCPVVAPFAATIGVVVVAGDVNVIVTSITTQFTDLNHVQLPMILLPAPIPTAQIGSNLVQARSGVTFPVTVNFGCGTASTGTVAMSVHLTDANGASSVKNLSVAVR